MAMKMVEMLGNQVTMELGTCLERERVTKIKTGRGAVTVPKDTKSSVGDFNWTREGRWSGPAAWWTHPW